MIKIYYHIYLVDGVDFIVLEQLNLIKKFIKKPYTLNIGISIPYKNWISYSSIKTILDKTISNYVIRNIEIGGDEMTTLSILENDRDVLSDDDFILYLHTKGASRQSDYTLPYHYTWRHLMNYFNIEKYKLAIDVLTNTDFNTYGVLLDRYENHTIYSGNFWWTNGKYIKSINTKIYKKEDRNFSQFYFIQSGLNWNPFSPYDRKNENHYKIKFTEEEYRLNKKKVI